MHILLTDVLTCPRCGPEYGLILLAQDVRERRVLEGVLGCPGCRTQYPVERGGASLGAPPETAVGSDPERAERIAALLGVTHGPALLLVVGPASADAGLIADLLPDVEIVACGYASEETATASERSGVSRIGISGEALPFTAARLHGVALTGDAAERLLEEGARVVSPLGRLVLEPVPSGAAERLTAAGLRVLAQDAGMLVAGR